MVVCRQRWVLSELEVGTEQDFSDQGLVVTTMRAVNAIPYVCEAGPGVIGAIERRPFVYLSHHGQVVARWRSPLPGEHMAYNAACAADHEPERARELAHMARASACETACLTSMATVSSLST